MKRDAAALAPGRNGCASAVRDRHTVRSRHLDGGEISLTRLLSISMISIRRFF